LKAATVLVNIRNFFKTSAQALVSSFEVDSRAIVCCRIWFGILLTLDWFDHYRHANYFYGPRSIFGGSPGYQIVKGAIPFTLFDAVHASPAGTLLWGLILLSFIAFTLGYKTRLSAFFSYIGFVSLGWQRWPTVAGFDILMALLLFFYIFLPEHRPNDERKLRSFPIFLIYIQVCLVYWVGFFAKMTGYHWREGSAIYYSMEILNFSYPWVADLSRALPFWILKSMTWLTLLLEFLIPFFLLISRVRLLGVGLLFVLHLQIFVLLNLHYFSPVMWGFSLLFLPAAVYDRIRFPLDLKVSNFTESRWDCWLRSAVLLIFLGVSGFSLKYHITHEPPKNWLENRLFELMVVSWNIQNWFMYAPNPGDFLSWVVTEAKYSDGKVIDIDTKKIPQFDSAPEGLEKMPYKWRKFTFWLPNNYYFIAEGLRDYYWDKGLELISNGNSLTGLRVWVCTAKIPPMEERLKPGVRPLTASSYLITQWN